MLLVPPTRTRTRLLCAHQLTARHIALHSCSTSRARTLQGAETLHLLRVVHVRCSILDASRSFTHNFPRISSGPRQRLKCLMTRPSRAGAKSYCAPSSPTPSPCKLLLVQAQTVRSDRPADLSLVASISVAYRPHTSHRAASTLRHLRSGCRQCAFVLHTRGTRLVTSVDQPKRALTCALSKPVQRRMEP